MSLTFQKSSKNDQVNKVLLFKHFDSVSVQNKKVTRLPLCVFVCVEVLRPSQPNGVTSSAVSLPKVGNEQNCWKCPYPLPTPHKNTIFQKLVSWSELFIFLKNHQNRWIQLIRWKFSPLEFYLATLLLRRLSPLSGWPVLCTFFCQKLTTALHESAEGEELTVENISWSISSKECCRPGRGCTHNLLITSWTCIRATKAGPLCVLLRQKMTKD